MKGFVNDRLEPILPIYLVAGGHDPIEVEALIDTGCTGYLVIDNGIVQELGLTPVGSSQYYMADGTSTMADIYLVEVVTEFGRVTVEAFGCGTTTLVGMALLVGLSLKIAIVPGGEVSLETLE